MRSCANPFLIYIPFNPIWRLDTNVKTDTLYCLCKSKVILNLVPTTCSKKLSQGRVYHCVTSYTQRCPWKIYCLEGSKCKVKEYLSLSLTFSHTHSMYLLSLMMPSQMCMLPTPCALTPLITTQIQPSELCASNINLDKIWTVWTFNFTVTQIMLVNKRWISTFGQIQVWCLNTNE